MLSAGIFLAALAVPAHAVTLNYTWSPGDTHPFRYRDDTQISMQMMGMNTPPVTVSFQTDFSERVLSVAPDGSAQLEVTVEALSIYEQGRLVATLDDFPAEGRVLSAVVDRKGNISFPRMTTLLRVDGQYLVGTRTSASASASVNGETISVFASVDASTGRVTAGSRVVKTEEAQPVDVLPREILEMMILPDGDLQPNAPYTATFEAAGMGVSQSLALSALKGGVAHLDLSVKSTADLSGNAAPTASGSVSMPGMGMGMDLSAMGMGGMGGMPAAGGPSAGMDLTLDADCQFDTSKGRFLSVEGRLQNSMSVGGMGGVNISSQFSLTRR